MRLENMGSKICLYLVDRNDKAIEISKTRIQTRLLFKRGLRIFTSQSCMKPKCRVELIQSFLHKMQLCNWLSWICLLLKFYVNLFVPSKSLITTKMSFVAIHCCYRFYSKCFYLKNSRICLLWWKHEKFEQNAREVLNILIMMETFSCKCFVEELS